ncbi:HelD family protein [Euzebya tangerina]|uniref:HelD family protein n=1 Tax=Euzebya tangerina TaxID=591198 RepID=UPI000E30E9BB|nr:AAA family ATPase [Euzebya tangerina]
MAGNVEWEDDQRRLDEALHARAVLTERLGASTIPNLDQYSEAIIHSIRSDVVRRLHQEWVPFFGALDGEDEPGRTYIGPYAVHAPDDDRLLIQSWRAPDSATFYEATADQPLGITQRRRYASDGVTISGVVIEELAGGEDDRDGLRAAIVQQVLQTRTGSMQDIMTTITPEQHRVIRDDAPVTVLQGGPGTGKTAVGLHRIAYLLFSRRGMAALIIGPSDRFIDYVGQVLPALGEEAVGHMTITQLGEDPTGLVLTAAAPRHLVGDARMAALLDHHAWSHICPPTEPTVVTIRDRRVTLRPQVVAEAIAAARTEDPRYGVARTRFVAALVEEVAASLKRRVGLLPSSDVVAEIRRNRELSRLIASVWPTVTPSSLLRTALADARLVGEHYGQNSGVHRAVRGTRKPRPVDSLLTALVELAGEIMGLEFDGRRYDHVVVDEAQELTAVELRMIKRRIRASGHLTLLGDLAQQLGTPHTADWSSLVTAATLRMPDVRTLDISYRVPSDLLALAAPFAPDREIVPTGVRQALAPTAVLHTPDPLREAIRVAGHHIDDTVGIIVADATHVRVVADPPSLAAGHSLVPLSESRGLEFGHVALVEPADLLDEGGPGGLYIALTRAVKSLTILHRRSLPTELQAALP